MDDEYLSRKERRTAIYDKREIIAKMCSLIKLALLNIHYLACTSACRILNHDTPAMMVITVTT